MHGMNPSTPHLHARVNKRFKVLLTYSRRPPCPPRLPFCHSCGLRLVPTNCGDTLVGRTFANCTSNDPRRGPFGKNDGHSLPRTQGRITGSYERNLSSKEATDQSPKVPPILVASTCPGMYCHTHAGSPTKSAMPSHVFHPLTAVSPSAWRVCVTRDKNRIHMQVPVHILPKGSSRRTCRNSASEVRALSRSRRLLAPRQRKKNDDFHFSSGCT